MFEGRLRVDWVLQTHTHYTHASEYVYVVASGLTEWQRSGLSGSTRD
jgi:hypothetical protein